MIIRISPGDGSVDSRPISKWTKKAMIEAVRGRMSEKDADRLAGMPLEELRSLFLVRDGNYVTGSATIPGACRTTTYWRIDWGFIREFLEGHRWRCSICPDSAPMLRSKSLAVTLQRD